MNTEAKSTTPFDVRAGRLRRYVEQAITDQYALLEARRRIEQLEQLVREYSECQSEAQRRELDEHARMIGIKL